MLLIRVQGWVRQLNSCMQVAMSKYRILTIGVAVVNIGLLLAIGLCFRQMDAERLEQIRARAIITECDALSKSFHDAGWPWVDTASLAARFLPIDTVNYRGKFSIT
jgi:hypothetical protein